jgi:indolepyruvate ferredoxin oxidoreductase beta subunit
MEKMNIILCGLGGQGILFMTKILAHAALNKAYNILGAETHGMAQRGGSVISHLRIGQSQSSLVRAGSADMLLSLDESECYRNLAFAAPGAHIFVNTVKQPQPSMADYLKTNAIAWHGAPAGAIAREINAPFSTNLALVGFFAAFNNDPFSPRDLRAIIDGLSPERFKEVNFKVFDAGLAYGESVKREVLSKG